MVLITMNVETHLLTSQIETDCNDLFAGLNAGNLTDTQSKVVFQKLQEIRLWQLMQQEELKKQQQSQLMLLKSQHIKTSLQMKLDYSNETKNNENEGTDEIKDILAYPLVDLDDEVSKKICIQ